MNDRFLLQEQRQKEQDERLKKLTEHWHSLEVIGKPRMNEIWQEEEQAASLVQTLKDARKDLDQKDQTTRRAIQAAGQEPQEAKEPDSTEANNQGVVVEVSNSMTQRGASGTACEPPQQLQEPLQQIEHFEWSPSIWEACLFISTAGIDSGAGFQLLCLLLMNIVAQCTFLLIAFRDFTSSYFTDEALADSQNFRLTIGHDVKFQDTLYKRSLMSRVCDGGAGLELGTIQANLVEQIDNYLGEGLLGGPTMCTLAISCWTLVFFAELDRSLNLTMGLAKLPRQRVTTFTVNPDKQIAVEGWSTPRFVFAIFLLLVRLTIGCGLLLCGCMWLAYEVDAQQLLLNAVALGFVLEVDEMLFTIAPGQAKALMSRLEPLPAVQFPACRGADIFSALQGILVFVIIGVMWWQVLDPQIDKMQVMYDVFCAGNLDFVYAQDNMGLTYMSVAEALSDDTPRVQMAQLAVAEGIRGLSVETDSFDLTYGLVAADFVRAVSPASIVTGMTVAELVDMLNPLCIDELWEYLPVLKRKVGAFLGDEDWASHSCASMAGWLLGSEAASTLLRMICPITAGCHVPLTPVPSLEPIHGCPTACGTYLRISLAQMPCEDQEVIGTSYWESWLGYVGAHMSGLTMDPTAAVARLGSQGCSGLIGIENFTFPVFSQESLCAGTQFNVHPFAYACPRTCGCLGSSNLQLVSVCPSSCVRQA